MRKCKPKHKPILICVSIFLCIILLAVSLFSILHVQSSINAVDVSATITDDSKAEFRDAVHIAFPSDEIDKHFKQVQLHENGEYTLYYSKKLPAFFAEMRENDVFCIYPHEKSKSACFERGFCGKLIKKSEENCSVTFVVPQISEVFRELKIDTSTAIPSGTAFYPNTYVESYSIAPMQMHTLSATNDAVFSIGNTDLDFKYQKNDRSSVNPEYQILCKQLKIKLKQKMPDEFELGGSITLEYPSVKMLLDYECDERTGEVLVYDYEFDFVTKEKIDLTCKGKREFTPPDPKQDWLDVFSPVDIVDVTEHEDGKRVLGTYVIGYNVKLPDVTPISPNNTANDVGYLSLGIALQLAVTAKGEIEISCEYKQSGMLNVFSSSTGETGGMVKGYDYPHPVLENVPPNGSREQEIPSVTSTYKGEMSLNMGVSIDVGICILGMIPIKVANGLEAEIGTEFNSAESEKKETIVQNSYVEKWEDVTFSIDIYSDLKFHLGAKPKLGGKSASVSAGTEMQLFRKRLFSIPKAVDFGLDQCCIGGVQLGAVYSDDQIAEAIAAYASKCKDYSLLAYTKDAAINTAFDKAVSELGLQTEELLESLQLDYPSGKLDCYASGALFVRDSKDVVCAIILFGSEFRNELGLHPGLKTKDIEHLYSVPSESYATELEVGAIAELLIGQDVDNINLQAQIYKAKENNCRMEIYSKVDTSQIIVLSLMQN